MLAAVLAIGGARVLPGGVEATGKILDDADGRFGRSPKVIMLAAFDWDEHAATAIRHGASGFLLKDGTPEFVCESIRAVHGGNVVIAPHSLAALLPEVPAPVPEVPAPVPEVPLPYRELTERERDVFNAVALGLANLEISDELFLGESTVKTHVGAILRRLALRDRGQIVVYSCENGIGR